jgi:murein DD-endopeptidase MepM/ murein hydrolase activator NlpD
MGFIPGSEDKMTISLGSPFLEQVFPITQGFGENARDYSGYNLIAHSGIDYGCPVGTKIYAVSDGVVTKIQTDESGYGLHIRIQHPNGIKPEFRTIYAHLSNVSVTLNQTVARGKMIGRSGNTGNSTGPHLHFEMRFEPLVDNGYGGASDPTPYFEDAVTSPETPENPVTLPEKGVAHVSVPFLYIRSSPSTVEARCGCFYQGSTIKYDAIITNQGGDVWLQFNGGTLYCAAFYDNVWNVEIK